MEDPSSTTTAPRHFHIPADGLDLLEHLLVYDPEERWTARQAWQHPVSDVVRERVLNEVEAARHKLLLPP
jgi:serine/threonine protein kinase